MLIDAHIYMYADNTTQDVSDTCKCIDVIENKLNRDLINTLWWMNKNMLTINPKKTQYIDFGWEQKKLRKLKF